jgi:hypothetical protein
MKANGADEIATRKLALAAGKQHRAGMQRLLELREELRKGVLPDLKPSLERLRKKAKIDKKDCDPLIRIIDLIAQEGSDLSPGEIALEVRGIHKKLCRSKTVHPMLLAFAGIADDSVSHAAKDAGRAPAPNNPKGTVPSWLSVAGADLDGFLNGYDFAKRANLNEFDSIWFGIMNGSTASSVALDIGLPLF